MPSLRIVRNRCAETEKQKQKKQAFEHRRVEIVEFLKIRFLLRDESLIAKRKKQLSGTHPHAAGQQLLNR